MTKCPCDDYHLWIDADDHLVDTCEVCDCCAWCNACEMPRPPFNLIHQCHWDPRCGAVDKDDLDACGNCKDCIGES